MLIIVKILTIGSIFTFISMINTTSENLTARKVFIIRYLTSFRTNRLLKMFKPSRIFLLTAPRRYFFCESVLLFMFYVCLCYAVLSSFPFSLLIICWERTDLFVLLYVMFLCVFCHFPMWCSGSGVVLYCIDS